MSNLVYIKFFYFKFYNNKNNNQPKMYNLTEEI